MQNIHQENLFLFISYSFISEISGDIYEGKLVNKNSQNVYWLCRTSSGLFYWPKAVFENFLLSWDQRFTVSVKPWSVYFFHYEKSSSTVILFDHSCRNWSCNILLTHSLETRSHFEHEISKHCSIHYSLVYFLHTVTMVKCISLYSVKMFHHVIY